MSRVAHWAQERAVVDYATGIDAQNVSPDFAPCAVICEECGVEKQEFEGLPLAYTRDVYQLFMSAPSP